MLQLLKGLFVAVQVEQKAETEHVVLDLFEDFAVRLSGLSIYRDCGSCEEY